MTDSVRIIPIDPTGASTAAEIEQARTEIVKAFRDQIRGLGPGPSDLMLKRFARAVGKQCREAKARRAAFPIHPAPAFGAGQRRDLGC